MLLVGIAWIVVMTAICYVGIEISANFQKVLLGIEITMLLILSDRGAGEGRERHGTPRPPDAERWSWFNPFNHLSATGFMVGFTLMLFIYWGWDTAVSVNEETEGLDIGSRAGPRVLSTVILLATYALVVMATQSYAGIGTTGIGLRNPAHTGDVLSVLGGSIFGTSGFGSFMTHLLF